MGGREEIGGPQKGSNEALNQVSNRVSKAFKTAVFGHFARKNGRLAGDFRVYVRSFRVLCTEKSALCTEFFS